MYYLLSLVVFTDQLYNNCKNYYIHFYYPNGIFNQLSSFHRATNITYLFCSKKNSNYFFY